VRGNGAHAPGSLPLQARLRGLGLLAQGQQKLRKTFRNLSEAKGWRADATSAVRKGTLRSPSRLTLREAASDWLKGAEDGLIRTRSGDEYKPSALRSYQASLEQRVLPELGAVRLSSSGIWR
jgi:hypothetical protein